MVMSNGKKIVVDLTKESIDKSKTKNKIRYM